MDTNKKFCPTCGAPLDGDLIGNKIECRYCGNVIEIAQPKEKKTYQSKTTIAEEPICEITWIDTYIKGVDFIHRERRVAFQEGEKRNAQYIIYNSNVTKETTATIYFEILNDNGETIVQNEIPNCYYHKDKRNMVLESSLTSYSIGIYHIRIKIGCSKIMEIPIIIGNPAKIDNIIKVDNLKVCANIAKEVISRYNIKSEKITYFQNSLDKKQTKIKYNFGMAQDSEAYMYVDSGVYSKGKKGIIICQHGIYCSGIMSGNKLISWRDLILQEININNGLNIGNSCFVGFGSLDSILADLIADLQREIVNKIFQRR